MEALIINNLENTLHMAVAENWVSVFGIGCGVRGCWLCGGCVTGPGARTGEADRTGVGADGLVGEGADL